MQKVCPHCGSGQVRRSSARASDGLRRLVLYRSMRCHQCKRRFWLKSRAKPVALGLIVLIGLGMVVRQLNGQPGRPVMTEVSSQDALYQRAKRGDPQAELEMGMRYAQGDGFIKNPKEAAQWFAKAAKQGSGEAQYQLGLALLAGEGVVQDFQAAFGWIEKPAKKGYAPAQYTLGELYRFGTGIQMDKAKAYLWFNLAAAQGVEDAAKARDSVGRQLKVDELKAMQEAANKMSAVAPEPAAVSVPEKAARAAAPN
ncbi:MAG TPA: tetratricopeptide repeat protein [Thiobacillaceae bacterium]|nr:tetratricopeptide repeat protein [Thiobacillaceae bacterium]